MMPLPQTTTPAQIDPPQTRLGLRYLTLALWFALWLVLAANVVRAETVKDVRKKMGSRFEITAVAASKSEAQSAIDSAYSEIDRLEAMISSWQPNSETTAINNSAGAAPVRVSPELLGLVTRAGKVAGLTLGAFDITFASFGNLWDFKAEAPTLPDPDQLTRALELVNHNKVQIDHEAQTVMLAEKGMRIGFGAIGKGFAANRAADVLKQQGIDHGVVNAGGDLLAFGHRETGEPWTIGIADPKARDEIFAYLNLSQRDGSRQAVVTSGDYESFITIDGQRYAHILDPRTGYPVRGVKSVTVLCPDAELADALATSVFVMGAEQGLALINKLRRIEALVVTDDNELLFSKNLESKLAPSAEGPGNR